ncbi:hypothetical protein OJAV_G00034180 [Oryzias javanicus]|uniref:Secreted protein n=1 Tax=Oryzias javanicus TaxID=123683 RepID=A0A3S2PEN6_ORYJA|nr:hypothetical protein OJAV_G00034180 [Oryzias javanicus]
MKTWPLNLLTVRKLLVFSQSLSVCSRAGERKQHRRKVITMNSEKTAELCRSSSTRMLPPTPHLPDS